MFKDIKIYNKKLANFNRPKFGRIGLFILSFLFLSNISFSQDNLQVNVKFLIDDGNLDGASIRIDRNGQEYKV
ncbi:MAG: hypothetical protein J0M08_12760, partial [Bacteroidetes bacterium]|nr:hypothetical protein [Bacteroidota bacterium]